ncbi:hypothetical protein LP43_0083 [Methylophaga thiooxydans]|uniref:Cyclic GMP-AMP synthase n=1 Tax=Methylophaga thiooxydans TaxID=392484 RepID=A0A0A0BJ30_9GAMM|nr:hypothetical protein [Methylophaga thiooxydans]KGM07667.1 hypothetical protein LP43_0083 [Methylophaga thiooxydans]
MPNKFHSLLASTTHESLLANLDLSKRDEEALVDAAKEIRSAIIAGFVELREKLQRQHLDYEVPKPKFAIQGSYIYGTLNSPANPPKQQVDIDLGMYLPFSALGDGQRPKTATQFYFSAVTEILEKYIQNKRKHWVLPPASQQKDTCIRVLINEKTHIDIPLYAVPEGELNRVTEANLAAYDQDSYMPEMMRGNELSLEYFALEAITPDVIHMAHRKDGWQPSDALVIRDWVKSQFRKMGSMIRPVNRFLKAWRDHAWPDGGGPSSIFLLAHSLHSFPSDTNGLSHCEALEAVINELPSVFNRPLLVPRPTSTDKFAKEDLCERISDEEKKEFYTYFESLRQQYALAKRTDPRAANSILISIFGRRMPNDPSRIVVTNTTTSRVEEIRGSKPDIRPLYTTDRSNSG